MIPGTDDNANDMGRHHATPAVLLIVVALLPVGRSLHADAIYLPPPEAPTTIFSTTLGSMDVDLSLLGSWTAGVSIGGGILFAPGLPPQLLDSFPGIDTGFIFSQTPDITLSLELMKRYFLNVTVVGSFADNYIQMGYRGGPNEALRYVILGTQGITIPPSILMQIPSQPKGSLGAMAQFVSGGSTNDLLLRWDATLPKHKTFVGKNELVEQETEISSYLKGVYFYLPDRGLDANSLELFIEDDDGSYVSGTGRTYKAATYNDAVLDSLNGLVYLRTAVKGRVLVYYKKGGLGVGSAGIGTAGFVDVGVAQKRNPSAPVTFTWSTTNYFVSPAQTMNIRKENLPGVGDCLLLWEPGDNSPFEIDSSYAFSTTPPTDVSKISIKMHAKDAKATLPNNVIFQSDPTNSRFLVLRNQSIRATFYNFYPFDDSDGLLYGPARDSVTGGQDFDIFVQMLKPVTEYVLESNIESGSVQVTINGITETRFTVEPVSGKLTLLTDVVPTDRIEVTYRKAEAGISGGDILFAWRDKIPLDDWSTLTLSAGVRWNANPWTYTQEAYTKSGTVIATVGMDGKTDTVSYSAEAGVSYTNPDTTGFLRLFPMEGNSMEVDLSEDDAYPASLPTGIGSLTQANRGYLYYRDYREYGALGSTSLQDIWTSPPPSRMSYTNGNRMGPYDVSGSDGNLNSTSLVFEYDLASGEWVGSQVPISSGADVDLSSARAVTVRMRGLDMTGDVEVYLQLGSVSEDLDGSGVLKAESSSTDTGFSFADQAHPGVTLRVGAGPKLEGNGKLDSEDTNANSLLDYEDSNRVDTETAISSLSLTTSWKNFTFPLSDADRQKLLQTRGVRIVIVQSGAVAATGKILVDSLTIEGTPFWPKVTGTDTRDEIQVQEVTENRAQFPPTGGDFESAFEDTYNRFHPSNETNQVLETVWSSLTSQFTVQGFVPNGTGGIQYQTIVSYVRSTVTETFTFSLLDTDSRGIVWNVSIPGDNKWHEITVSRKDGTVLLDGGNIGAPTRFDSSYGDLAQFTVTSSATPPGSGALYIDEIYCTDPEGVFGAAFVGTVSARFPGQILNAGRVPVLANVALRQDLALYSAGFAPLYGVPYQAEDLSSRTHVDADLLFTRTSLDLALRDSAGALSASGGHRVTIPNTPSPVTVTDAFTLSTKGGFTRENVVTLTPGRALSVTFDATANASPDETDTSGLLTQGWQAGVTLNPFSTLSIVSALTLSQALTGYTLARDWYGERWARETGLLLPWEGGGDVSRAEKLDFKAGVPAAPFGVSFEAEADASGSDYPLEGSSLDSFTQQSELATSLTFSHRIGRGDSGDTVSLAYRRAYTLTTTPDTGPRFAAETGEFGRVLSGQSYMLETIPFVEIFTDNISTVEGPWKSASAATYKPSVTMTLQRSYGSRISDLFIPSGAELAVGQDLSKSEDLFQTVQYVRPKITTRAVNLFGQMGSVPRLPMVLTDEYSLSLNASIDKTTPPLYPQYGSGPILSTLSIAAYSTFTGANDSQLTLVDTVSRNQTDIIVFTNDMQALLDWRVMPKDGIPFPLIPSDVARKGHFEHRESGEVTVGYQDSGTFHLFTLLLGHATSLVYEGHGSIKASINLGMDCEDLGSTGMAWRLAFRAALEAKLTF